MTESPELRSAERMVFFTDAVVAIAMTLLILPLMESVSEAATHDLSASQWAGEHRYQLLSFAISFLLIASFWRGHHALYEHVEKYTSRLMSLNIVWMFTIVWIPVATAISTGLELTTETIALYIGSLIATSLVSAAVQIHVMRHPEIWKPDFPVTNRGLAVNVAMALLLVVAMVIAIVFPAINYFAMLVLMAMRPLIALLSRALPAPRRP